jgi:phosphoribosyl 1,2-cyclic phosphodiesterase
VIIRFLGTHNAESVNTRLVSFLIDGLLAIDAGSLTSELDFAEQAKIRAILLSHGHYDHIRAIPAFAYNNSNRITRIFATRQVLEILSSHLMDGLIYPDFTNDTSFLGKATLQLVPLELFKPQDIEGYQVMALPVNHSAHAVGFRISSSDGRQVFYSGDTGPGLLHVWEEVDPQLLIIDVSVPNKLESVAKEAGHLCPKMLKGELSKFRLIKGYIPKVILIHLSPQFEPDIAREVKEVAKELDIVINIAHEGETLVL